MLVYICAVSRHAEATHLQDCVCVIARQGRGKVQALLQHVQLGDLARARGMHCECAVCTCLAAKAVHSADISGVVARAVKRHERAVGVGVPWAYEQLVIIANQYLCRLWHLQAWVKNHSRDISAIVSTHGLSLAGPAGLPWASALKLCDQTWLYTWITVQSQVMSLKDSLQVVACSRAVPSAALNDGAPTHGQTAS